MEAVGKPLVASVKVNVLFKLLATGISVLEIIIIRCHKVSLKP